MANYLLDTNILAFHVRGSSAALTKRLRRTPIADVAISVVTEMEVRFGVERNPSLKIRPAIEALLATLRVLPIDSEVARAYARTRALLEGKGKPMGALDLIIASHALALDLTLVTNDTRGFQSVAGLRIEDWSRP